MRSAQSSKKGRKLFVRGSRFDEAYNEGKPILSVMEYRKLMGDNITSNERIEQRIGYLVFFTRKIARGELEKYVKNKAKK